LVSSGVLENGGGGEERRACVPESQLTRRLERRGVAVNMGGISLCTCLSTWEDFPFACRAAALACYLSDKLSQF
jgi:hypothetical protein